MNFQYITPVDKTVDILDIAFRKARMKGQMKKLKGNWLQIIRQKEAMKLDIIKDSLVTRLDKIVDMMPRTLELPDFYVKLMKLTMDFVDYKRSCAAVGWASKQIRNIHKKTVSVIYKEKDRNVIKKIMNQFYGRVSSIVKQVDPNIKTLNKSRRIFRSFPDVKEMFTVCLYGFPNVGKSTLLNKLTGSKAETAAYAFTTKSINSGFIGEDIQILDVPGTLARDKLNAVELQADLVLNTVANLIVYVFDISGHCGFSIEDQQKLLKKLGKKDVIVFIAKQDLQETKEALKDFEHEAISLTKLKSLIKEVKSKVVITPKIEEFDQTKVK